MYEQAQGLRHQTHVDNLDELSHDSFSVDRTERGMSIKAMVLRFIIVPCPPSIRLSNTNLTKCTVAGKGARINLHDVVAVCDWDPLAEILNSRRRAGVKHVWPRGFRRNKGSIQVDTVM